MRQNLKAIVAVGLVLMTIGNAFPAKQSVKSVSKQCNFANYTWYRDEEMSDPVGTVSDINVEIYRLSVLYPGYTFSSSFSMGLYPFHYGQHYFYPTVIIYSDRDAE
jgi:hypothetical protein